MTLVETTALLRRTVPPGFLLSMRRKILSVVSDGWKTDDYRPAVAGSLATKCFMLQQFRPLSLETYNC